MQDHDAAPEGAQKSSHGGAREGAGRPFGTRNSAPRASAKKRAVAEQVERANAICMPILGEEYATMTPLEIILTAARIEAQAGNWPAAASIARDAAPYVHAKLSSVETKTVNEPSQLSDKELGKLIEMTPPKRLKAV